MCDKILKKLKMSIIDKITLKKNRTTSMEDPEKPAPV